MSTDLLCPVVRAAELVECGHQVGHTIGVRFAALPEAVGPVAVDHLSNAGVLHTGRLHTVDDAEGQAVAVTGRGFGAAERFAAVDEGLKLCGGVGH